MQTLTLIVCVLASYLAVTALPLSVDDRTLLARLADANGSGERAKIFLVRVDAQQKPTVSSENTLPTQEPANRLFPWPYPPVFESALPEQVKQRLIEIYEDATLGAEECANKMNAVFDSLPQEVIERLPLPAEYERLPFDVYKRIHYIHVAPGFKWAERQQLIQNIVESRPPLERQLMGTPRFGGPPPGFENVISTTVYKQLLFVHYNPQLSKEQKAELITRIMHQVPQEQIERLPLPAGMEMLPVDLQRRVHALVYDYSVPQSVRAQRVRDFVQSLPEEIRPSLRRRK